MVRCAVATVSNRILPSRAIATPEWSACVLPESDASCSRAAAIVAGLEKRRLPSAKVWSAPSTSAPGRRRATASAFSRASSSAIFSGEAPACGASAARSSISAGIDLDRNAGRFQQRAAHLALRGEHERHATPQIHGPAAASRRRSCRSEATAAAVSSIERRVTSINGQPWRVQSCLETAISSDTAWRST